MTAANLKFVCPVDSPWSHNGLPSAKASMSDTSSVQDELDYFTDIRAKEEELKRLNAELDLQKLQHNLEEEWHDPTRTISSGVRDGHKNARVTAEKNHSFAIKENDDQCASSPMAASSASNSPRCIVADKSTALTNGIGKNAMIRLQKARIETLDSQLKEALRGKHEAEDTSSKLRLQLKESTQERKRLQKALSEAKLVVGRSKVEEECTRTTVGDLKMDLNQTKRELAAAQKSLKVAESEHKGREIRLSRALKEVERYKKSVASRVSEKRQDDEEVRREKDKLSAQIKSLERQRAELLAAFKKQLKLIDILKRQKVHAEAAKLLQFTEEEFMKVIEWPDWSNK